MARAVLFPSQRYKRIKGVFRLASSLKLFLLTYHLLELVQRDSAVLRRRRLRYHPIYRLLWLLLAHHFEHDTKLVSVDEAAPILIERLKGFVAFVVFFGRQPVLGQTALVQI